MSSILITGASRGIGRAIALEIAKIGQYKSIHLTCRSNEAKLNKVVEQINHLNPDIICTSHTGPIRSLDDATSLYNSIGPVDSIINNAATSYTGLLIDMNEEEWNDTIISNISSLYYYSHTFLPDMIARKSGKIINISSIWGSIGASCEVAYSASKGAVNLFTKALAKELAPSNIQVNAVAFGMVNTDMNSHLSKKEIDIIKEAIPSGRIMEVEEAAEAVIKVLNMPDYMTGQIITVDGGWF